MSYAHIAGYTIAQDMTSILWWDPSAKRWEKIPSLVDKRGKKVSASITHFSGFAGGVADPENPRLPGVEAFQNDLFTGAANVSYPLEVPPGRGGLTPQLRLSYSSASVTGMVSAAREDDPTASEIADTQASWAGLGWEMDFGHISRDMGNNFDDQADDHFSLSLNGVGEVLLAGNDGYYHTKSESFLRATRTYTGTADDSWYVWTKDGTEYFFEKRMLYYPGDFQPYVREWFVTKIQDVNGNVTTISYEDDPAKNSCRGTLSLGTYPLTVTYSEQDNNRYIIQFNRSGRNDIKWRWSYDTCVLVPYHKEKLESIQVFYDVNGSRTETKKYQFVYHTVDQWNLFPQIRYDYSGERYGKLTLLSVAEKDPAGNTLPAYSFTHGGNNLLQTASNGYGGKVTYTYENVTAGNWRYQDVVTYVDEFARKFLPPQYADDTYPGALFPGSHYYIDALFTGGAGSTVAIKAADQYHTQTTNVTIPWPIPGGGAHFGLDFTLDPRATYLKVWVEPVSGSYDLKTLEAFYWRTHYRVVSKATEDGMGNSNASAFTYFNPAMNDTAHSAEASGENPYPKVNTQFRGHDRVEQTDPLGNKATSYFYQDDAFKGRSHTGEQYRGASTLLAKSTSAYTYTVLGGVAKYVKLMEENTYAYPGPKQSRRTFDYDNYGNQTKEFDYGDVADSADDRSSHRTFAVNASAWIMDRPARERIYEGIGEDVGGPSLKTESTYYYDGATSPDTAPTKGLLTKATKGLGAVTTTASYGYDQWGNQTLITDSRGYTTTTAYDGLFHTYPVRQTNALGHQTATAYDYRFARPAVITDANGVATSYEYDTFGRTTKAIKPGDTAISPTLAYEYWHFGTPGEQMVMVKEKDDVSQYPRPGYHVQRRFFDGLGRTIQTNDQMADSRYSVVTTEYDSNGRVRRTSVPYVKLFSEATNYWYTPTLDAGIIKWATTDYDALGRVITTTRTDGSFSRQSYDAWTAAAIDENGHQKDFLSDAYGRLSQVKEYQGGSIFTTQYTYDILGRLTRVQDSQGNVTTMSYDALGRKVGMVDPDMGAWSYGYDASGNLTSQTDASSQTITFEYDGLNRLTRKNLPGGSYVLNHYDDGTSGAYRIGRLWKVDNPSSVGGGWTATFDARGRVISRTDAISGTAYTTGYTYDSLDRATGMTYPGGEVLSQSYDEQTLLKKVSSNLTPGLEYLGNPSPTTPWASP